MIKIFNWLRKIQDISIIVILEATLLYLAIVVLYDLRAVSLVDSYVAQFEDNFPLTVLGSIFIAFIGVLLASLVSGFWISFWQRKENSLNWIFGAVLGVILVNILQPGRIHYFFFLPFSLVAWIGGTIGKRCKLKLLRNQNGNNQEITDK